MASGGSVEAIRKYQVVQPLSELGQRGRPTNGLLCRSRSRRPPWMAKLISVPSPTRRAPQLHALRASMIEAVAEYRIVVAAVVEQVLPLVRAEVTPTSRNRKFGMLGRSTVAVSAIEIVVDGTRIAEIERHLRYRRQVVVAVRGIDESRETLQRCSGCRVAVRPRCS